MNEDYIQIVQACNSFICIFPAHKGQKAENTSWTGHQIIADVQFCDEKSNLVWWMLDPVSDVGLAME